MMRRTLPPIARLENGSASIRAEGIPARARCLFLLLVRMVSIATPSFLVGWPPHFPGPRPNPKLVKGRFAQAAALAFFRRSP